MSQRFSEYVRKERDNYPTPAWVTEVVVEYLKTLNIRSVWEPTAGEGQMVATLAAGGFKVTATDIATGLDFLSDKARSHRGAHCDAIITNPPYGIQGRDAERFIERGLELMRPHRGAVAMLLKVDFDSGITRRRLFAECPAWGTKIILMHRIHWFEGETGNTSSDNHAWFVWSWKHKGPPINRYGANLGDRGVLWRTDLEQELRSTSRSKSAATG